MTQPTIEQQITFLYTPDLARIDSFYQGIMGLPLKLDQGTCRIYQASREAYIGFCQRAAVPEAGNQIILTLVTSEVDEWYEYLSAQGVTFEKPPAVNPKYDIYHCFLRDPDGNLIEIQRFLHPF
jgi:catechol 2,3-dioxygenase-like lactoylglutathione lyase family enzyme